MNSFNCLLIGDGGVGKTALASVFTQNIYPEERIPTVVDFMSRNLVHNNQPVNLTVQDSAGQKDYTRVRLTQYPACNIIILCFAVNDKNSVENVKSYWLPEARHNAPSKPIILVGTKADTRHDSQIQSSYLISKDQSEQLKKQCGACLYVECSAKDRSNVDLVFVSAIKVLKGEIVQNPKPKLKICDIL
ncbi:uncharacterized protein LOC134847974 [Symsagittifera roscoffensis]|uniref:uncharacterized protein LOC134847974 n=1 Tax=Symsagittifera roscoffensis TaxID=84072 RepID=UPI00307BB2B1